MERTNMLFVTIISESRRTKSFIIPIESLQVGKKFSIFPKDKRERNKIIVTNSNYSFQGLTKITLIYIIINQGPIQSDFIPIKINEN